MNHQTLSEMASLVNDELPQNEYGSPELQEDGANGTKRKADDGSQAQQTRAKRNRYISIACNEVNYDTPCMQASG